MRIRSTKPEFWRSRRVASVSWDARLVLKGLESYVDDNGVGKDDVALIVGDVFSRDMLANPRETVARVSEAVSELHSAGFVHRYDVDGEHLIYLSWWERNQRVDKPGKGRFPRPDGTWEYGESMIRESVASPRETLVPGTGEQGNRGTGDQVTPMLTADAASAPAAASTTDADQDDEFDRFWGAYPRKVGKQTARKAWRTARRKVDLDAIRQALGDSLRAWREGGTPADKIPHPSTWLNREPWHDDPAAIAPRPTVPTSARRQEREDIFAAAEARGAAQDQTSRKAIG